MGEQCRARTLHSAPRPRPTLTGKEERVGLRGRVGNEENKHVLNDPPGNGCSGANWGRRALGEPDPEVKLASRLLPQGTSTFRRACALRLLGWVGPPWAAPPTAGVPEGGTHCPSTPLSYTPHWSTGARRTPGTRLGGLELVALKSARLEAGSLGAGSPTPMWRADTGPQSWVHPKPLKAALFGTRDLAD